MPAFVVAKFSMLSLAQIIRKPVHDLRVSSTKSCNEVFNRGSSVRQSCGTSIYFVSNWQTNEQVPGLYWVAVSLVFWFYSIWGDSPIHPWPAPWLFLGFLGSCHHFLLFNISVYGWNNDVTLHRRILLDPLLVTTRMTAVIIFGPLFDLSSCVFLDLTPFSYVLN